MVDDAVRILLVADTHLGFDSPQRPRLKRRRRGPDFLANFERALQPARRGQVDVVVHGGDLFDSKRVSPAVVEAALTPLAEIARTGVPVLIVPGNHEGSRVPLHLATATRNLRIFHRPETIVLNLRGIRVSLSGFPFTRRIGDEFDRVMAECGYISVEADCRLLCLHQSVEGATVGVQNFTFRPGPDVITGNSLPSAFDAVLAGHIHRSQHLTHDLAGRKLPTPVIYPGSVERTSFAERDEKKHYALVTIKPSSNGSKVQAEISFKSLPARPMVVVSVESRNWNPMKLREYLQNEISALEPDSVVQIRFNQLITEELRTVANVATLRSLAPETMNISLAGGRQLTERVSRRRTSH